MQRRILAVGHDAYRAGAQIVFLHILRWLRERTDCDLSLVLQTGGELVEEYASVLPTQLLPASRTPGSSSRELSRLRRARHRIRTRSDRLKPGSVDLIYANSTASASLAADLALEAGCPVVCHIHELDMSMRRVTSRARFREVGEQVDRYIAVSRAVERNLVVNYGVDPNKIELINPGIPLLQTRRSSLERSQVRAELGIPVDAFVVGGCGTVDWRKGTDVFLLIAKALSRRCVRRPVHFLWVGGEAGSLEPVQHDLERLDLAATVSFVGEQTDPMAYFELFDAFLLTSREDPFPLVCLEAAALGVPVVCFADGGGMPEFVEADAGFVVPYLDIEASADRLLELATSEHTRAALGRRAAEKVVQRCSIDVIGPQIAAVLDQASPLPERG